MKSQIKTRIVFYALLALIVVMILCVQNLKPTLKKITVEDCFDTVSEITALAKSDAPLIKCRSILRSLDEELSPNDENSTLFKFNGGENVDFSASASELLEFGNEFTKENPDLFSIYLYPLEKAWDIKNNSGTVPDVQSALEGSRREKKISLGALVKGYAADEAAELLRSEGVTSALINLGGNTYALGTKPDGTGWKIGVSDPKDADNIIGIITAEDLAVVTSGDYIRYFEFEGKRYHHIFDPKTGYPASNGVHSVTVIARSAKMADALSTAAFVAGVEKGNELLKKYGARGIFITDDTVYFSKSLEDIFKQEDFSYRYKFLY